jgi:hypothetical protein
MVLGGGYPGRGSRYKRGVRRRRPLRRASQAGHRSRPPVPGCRSSGAIRRPRGQSWSTWYTPSRAVKNGPSAFSTEIYLRSLQLPQSGGEEGEGNPCAGTLADQRAQMSSKSDTAAEGWSEAPRRWIGEFPCCTGMSWDAIGRSLHAGLHTAVGRPLYRWFRRLAPGARRARRRHAESSVSTGASPTAHGTRLDERTRKNRCTERVVCDMIDEGPLAGHRVSVASPLLRAIPGTLDASRRRGRHATGLRPSLHHPHHHGAAVPGHLRPGGGRSV